MVPDWCCTGILHVGRFCDGRDRIYQSKERRQHYYEKSDGVLYTRHIGDGKIFVYDVENVVKVRTGEEGYDALQDVE